MPVSIEAALQELIPSERKLQESFLDAMFLYHNGALSEAQHTRYQELRAEVMSLEQSLHETITSVLSPLGLEDRIEAPRGYPELPPMASMPSYPSRPVSTEGLGAVQVIWGVLAASTLVYLAIIGAIAFVAWKALQVAQDVIDRIVSVRENTRRYQAQVNAVQERFNACIRRTGNMGGCASLFRTPEPTYEQPPPRDLDPMLVFGALAGIGVAGTLGYMGYRLMRGTKAPRRISRRRGRPRRLSSAELERSLTEG